MPTLNQTIEIFDQFSFKHKALGKNLSRDHFYFGDDWELLAKSGKKYPLMLVSKLPTKQDVSGLRVHKFQVDFSDKVNLDESNETHVLSDTEQLCSDLIFYLDHLSDSEDVVLNIGEVSEITDYTEKRDDMVSGNYFTIEIRSHAQDNSCYLPIHSGTIFNSNYIYINGSIIEPTGETMALTTELFTNQTGANISLSQTVTEMVGVFNGSGQFITPVTGYNIVNNEIVFEGDPFEATTIVAVYQYQQ